MSKLLFGTDGIRGIPNKDLIPTYILKIAQAFGLTLKNKNTSILIAKDTRKSGDMLESLLSAGLTSVGINVIVVGVLSTPGLAYLTSILDVEGGIMISASHNPKEHNGIKLFSKNGTKLTKDVEHGIQQILLSDAPIPLSKEIGIVTHSPNLQKKYFDYIIKSIPTSLKGLKIGIDCANGATSILAESIFEKLGSNIVAINKEVNGDKINESCGSTHTEALAKLVKDNKLDVGFAFDGDGDRVITIDRFGNTVDGDGMLYILSQYLKDINALNNNTVVTTIMSNKGFLTALKDKDIKFDITSVGDSNVWKSMSDNNYSLGGETSGHVIVKKYATTGDGILTALLLASAMKRARQNLDEMLVGLNIYPSILKNIPVNDKNTIMENANLAKKISDCEEKLSDNGRILVRASGTENLVRVLVEAKTEALCNEYVDILEKEILSIN